MWIVIGVVCAVIVLGYQSSVKARIGNNSKSHLSRILLAVVVLVVVYAVLVQLDILPPPRSSFDFLP